MSVIDSLKALLGANPVKAADEDMQEVLDALASLKPKPIEDLDALEARRQPTPADAVAKLMQQKGLSAEIAGVVSHDITIPGAAGELAARVYTPGVQGAQSESTQAAVQGEGQQVQGGGRPVILYFHGGGFVIADIDVYDATPRSIAAQTGAILVSAHYRQAPEYPFPAAHDDAIAAWRWILENAASLGGDPLRIAIMGESAGANLAANVSIYARDNGLQMPISQGLVYPVADTNTHTLSYEENRNATPLNKPMMLWFVIQMLIDSDDKEDPRLRLVEQDLSNLPATFVVTAGIDPLRSEGEKLAENLETAGNVVQHRGYPGVTHEFFGMAPVVSAAREAQAFVAEGMRAAFDALPAGQQSSDGIRVHQVAQPTVNESAVDGVSAGAALPATSPALSSAATTPMSTPTPMSPTPAGDASFNHSDIAI